MTIEPVIEKATQAEQIAYFTRYAKRVLDYIEDAPGVDEAVAAIDRVAEQVE